MIAKVSVNCFSSLLIAVACASMAVAETTCAIGEVSIDEIGERPGGDGSFG